MFPSYVESKSQVLLKAKANMGVLVILFEEASVFSASYYMLK